MKLNELIEEIKKHAIYHCGEKECYKEGCTQVVDLGLVLGLVKQLDEPQPVKVPQFVADEIEYAKRSDWDLEDTFQDIAGNDDSSDIYQWYYSNSDNMDTFARAWLDGYEVEKEKRYLVKFKATKHYFDKDGNGRVYFSLAYKSHFTKKQLEEADFGWVFDCPGIEIEEVEG